MSKLLSINSYHYRRGGSDVVYLDHAALMESVGWKNAFFSMHHPLNIPCEWSEYFVDEIQYGNEYSISQKIVMASKVIYSFEAQNKIAKIIDRFTPKVAHSHCIYHHLSPSILSVLREREIPIVMTAHELKAICPAASMTNSTGICEKCKDGSFLNVLLNRCIKNSIGPSAVVALETLVHRGLDSYRKNVNKLITPSRFYYEKYSEWGWPKDKLIYIPNYVDSSTFRPEYDPGTYFLYFGRLSGEKGLATLIRAACKAKVALKIVGTGPEDASLKALAVAQQGDIEFLGYRSGVDLHNIVRAARAVVLPSEWYENAPMSVLESYALGKPVIGARIGGIPELVIEGETGWTYTSGNVDELTTVLQQTKVLGASTLAVVGRTARNFVATKFSRANYLEQVLSVYSELGVGV